MNAHPILASCCRAALLILAATAHHISSTPPVLGDKKTEQLVASKIRKVEGNDEQNDILHGPQWGNKIGMLLVRISPYTVWFVALLEATVRILSIFPSSKFSSAILRFLAPANIAANGLSTPISPLFAASVVAVYLGYRIRRNCFATLGRHFTFTHTTLSDHHLVTDGPYSIVRHASYSGEALVRGGAILMLLSAGSWFRECALVTQSVAPLGSRTLQSVLVRVANVALRFHVGWAIFNTTFLFVRAYMEDATLHEKFGPEWEEYRKRVPYKFIPYII